MHTIAGPFYTNADPFRPSRGLKWIREPSSPVSDRSESSDMEEGAPGAIPGVVDTEARRRDGKESWAVRRGAGGSHSERIRSTSSEGMAAFRTVQNGRWAWSGTACRAAIAERDTAISNDRLMGLSIRQLATKHGLRVGAVYRALKRTTERQVFTKPEGGA